MDWKSVLDLFYKTIIVFFILIVAVRIMGKREIGEISAFDVVVFFVISELFSLSLTNPELSIWSSLIPVAIIVVLQILTAYLSMKFQGVRKKVEGISRIIIDHGVIDQEAMRKERYTIKDLMLQLRSKDIQTPSEVEYAILENNGILNVIKKSDCRLNYPDPLIVDGLVNEVGLKRIAKDENWLKKEIGKQDFTDFSQIFIAIYLKNGFYIEKKCIHNKKTTHHRK